MGRGLVGYQIRHDAAGKDFGKDLGGIAEKTHRTSLTLLRPPQDHREGLVETVGPFVEIAGPKAGFDTFAVALDHQAGGTRERGGEGLGATHSAESGGQDPAPR